MQIRVKYFFLSLTIASVFWQCSETKEVDPNGLGTAYFPLEVGDFRIYQVEGVKYNSYQDSLVFSYQLKESVTDTFTNLESGISYKIEREKRNTDNETWVFDSLWTARKDSRTAVMVEHNVPIVKFSFPSKDSITWDGNRLNDKYADEFIMINVNEPYSIYSNTFNRTATVIQEKIPDLVVNWISKQEVFAEDIGLVYKENTTLIYRQDDFLGLEIIDHGMKYEQHLVEYGKE